MKTKKLLIIIAAVAGLCILILTVVSMILGSTEEKHVDPAKSATIKLMDYTYDGKLYDVITVDVTNDNNGIFDLRNIEQKLKGSTPSDAPGNLFPWTATITYLSNNGKEGTNSYKKSSSDTDVNAFLDEHWKKK